MSGCLRLPAWAEQALCAEVDRDTFFPEVGESAKPAKSVCAGCEVRTQCLDHALAIGELWHGIWGGMSPAERRAEAGRRGLLVYAVRTAAGAAVPEVCGHCGADLPGRAPGGHRVRRFCSASCRASASRARTAVA